MSCVIPPGQFPLWKGQTSMSRRRRRPQANPDLTATEALEMAETMSDGEAAQMFIAAEIMGVDYDEFLERLAKEHGA